MELIYKTRANSSPMGKPRVYFFAHPDDFEAYFEKICDEILEISNCAVWYKKDPASLDFLSAEFPDAELTLGGMQLVVIPVTRRFLTDEKILCSKEFRFFFEKHVPVLPIVEEPDIADLYQAVFKNMQYLSKFEIEVNSIPYAKKMENFLSLVLLKDETAEKIRAEFDTHVFVSYRKIDRKYANDFMRLLHSREEYEDVGIWYDEFLTPGENFNDEIAGAINRCNVFSLVITPNIVDGNNYVVATEYPLAVENGKAIFAAEFVDTDKKLIEEKFCGITDPVSARDAAAFDNAFGSVLGSLEKNERNDSAEHKFLIALAYLTGTEVEVNVEKALSILGVCAEKNYLPAMEKLVDIYHRGHGVAVDYEKAIAMQKRIVALNKAALSEKKAEVVSVASSLYTLANLYLDLYDFAAAAAIFDEALAILDGKGEENLTARDLYYYKLCYNQAALAYKGKNEPVAAAKYYLAGIELMKRHDSSENEVKEYLAEFYNNLGAHLVGLGDYEYGLKYFEEAMSVLCEKFDNSKNKDGAFGLIVAYSNLGATAEMQGEESIGYYERAAKLSDEYLMDRKETDCYRIASVVYTRAGIRYTDLRDFEKAEKMLGKGLYCLNKILENSRALEDLKDKANCYRFFANLRISEGRIEEARAYLVEAEKTAESAMSVADTPQCRRLLCSLYSLSGLLSQVVTKGEPLTSEMTDETREYYFKAIDALDPLVQAHFKKVSAGAPEERDVFTKDMVDDIESVASCWEALSRLDNVRVPTQRAELLYRWLTMICPDNEEYAEKRAELSARLEKMDV